MEGKIDEKTLKEIQKIDNPKENKISLSEDEFKKLEKPTHELEKETETNEDVLGIYKTIIDVLKDYVDMREEYYPLVSLWIIGTYNHKDFLTYPYLYFNAMKGSGKTRLLSLISHLSNRGKLVANMSESVLFRTANGSTICIDEFERTKGKEKANLRELLNAAYKKGIGVERSKKVIDKNGEHFEVERFDVFTPIAMANIGGMDEVLGDRSIKLTLEKTSNPRISKKLEIWDLDPRIKMLKSEINRVLVKGGGCRVVGFNIYREYNNYINTKHTLYIHNIRQHQTTHKEEKEDIKENNKKINFIDKILNTDLLGRHLELFFPLFLVARQCGEEVVDKIIEISKIIIEEKKVEDVYENRDISLIDFISKRTEFGVWISQKRLMEEFKEFIEFEVGTDKWLNSVWFGIALSRLNLVKNKRRLRHGIEVILNIEKAIEKIKMFK